MRYTGEAPIATRAKPTRHDQVGLEGVGGDTEALEVKGGIDKTAEWRGARVGLEIV
jgi:hypothetical protein